LSINYVVAGVYIGRKYIEKINVFQVKREDEAVPLLNWR
jgi:hypothetical protein